MSREKFEAWMTDEQWFHGSDFEWDERRNCYSQFGIHLAYKAWQAASKASEQQLAAVVAENAGLKSAVVRIFNYGYQHGHESTVEGNYVDIHRNDISEYHEDIVAEIAEEQTPATDAAIAKIQAQGVDAAIERLIQKFEGTGHIGVPVMVLEHFAASLRQGAAL